MEVTIIRKVELSMDEQKKYEVIKSLADHPAPNKQRAALYKWRWRLGLTQQDSMNRVRTGM